MGRTCILALLLLGCSSTTESRTIMLGADGGETEVDGSGGGQGIEAEGAPADTHPGGSKGDGGSPDTQAPCPRDPACPIASPFPCRELDGGCGCTWLSVTYCQ